MKILEDPLLLFPTFPSHSVLPILRISRAGQLREICEMSCIPEAAQKLQWTNMGVSINYINWGTLKWMVFNGTSY